MSLGKKFVRFCNDNVVAISGIALIIGIHWTWVRIQNVPSLVDPSEKKDLPIVIGAKKLAEIAKDKWRDFSQPPKSKEQ